MGTVCPGQDGSWNHHKGIKAKLPAKCAQHDKPIADPLVDLARRGLQEDTLVVCTVEFGHKPSDQDLSRFKDPPVDCGRGTIRWALPRGWWSSSRRAGLKTSTNVPTFHHVAAISFEVIPYLLQTETLTTSNSLEKPH